MKYINSFYKFMYGRYGIDNLYKFLFRLYIILFIINIFIKSSIINIISLIIFVIMVYRVFSRNITKRRKENRIYMEIVDKIKKPFKNIKRNWQDRECYIYKKCPKCKTTLKLPLPRKKGINHAKCPKCKKRLTIITFREEKIEIIRKKDKRK